MKSNILKALVTLTISLCATLSYAKENLPLNPFCQNNVKSVKLVLNKKILQTEVACSEEAKEYGLMNRKSLSENEGMLFIFDRTQTLSFWMKNTLIDLSIAYVDKDWTIIDIREMKANNLTMIDSKKPAVFAIEASPYWFSKNNIKVGDKVLMTH